jgi:hypothetical protein
MMNMQDRLVGIFERQATAAGHELVVVEGIAGRGGQGNTTGSWLVMDDLDTRLVIGAEFERTGAKFALAGQAVTEPERAFWAEHKLFPQPRHRDELAVEFYSAYADGDRLRKLEALVHDLLAPYAKPTAHEFFTGEVIEFQAEPDGLWQDGTFLVRQGATATVSDDEGQVVPVPVANIRVPQREAQALNVPVDITQDDPS